MGWGLGLAIACLPVCAQEAPQAPQALQASQAPPAPPAVVEEALGILRDQCVDCHRPGKAKGGLKLTSLEFLKAGAGSGPVVQGRNPGESSLFQVLAAEGEPHMPPKKQLSPRQIAALKTWIEQGTPWDASVMDRPPEVQPVVFRPMPKTVRPVLVLGFSPDGKSLALSRGGEIEIRDAADPKLPVRVSFPAHEELIRSLAWAPDSSVLATGGYQRVRFWDAQTGAGQGEVRAPLAGDVNALLWAPAGDVLWVADSIASRAAYVRRLRWPAREWSGTWKAHDDSLLGMALSPEGQWLATAGADRIARRWDAQTNALLATYEGHTNQVLAVLWDPAKPRLATIGGDRELKVWDRDSREQDAVLGDKKQVFSCMAWSADGSRLAALTDRGNGSLFSNIEKHTGAQAAVSAKVQKLDKVDAILQSVAFFPDGSRLLGGSADGRLFLWKAADGKLQPFEGK